MMSTRDTFAMLPLVVALGACGLSLSVDESGGGTDGGPQAPRDATAQAPIDAAPTLADASSPADAAPVDAGDHCQNGRKDGDEGALDCGGSCAKKCALADSCNRTDDCADGLTCRGGLCQVPASCKELHTERPTVATGVYKLQTSTTTKVFAAQCDMTEDGGGWTLALKADGTKPTFAYFAGYWENETLLNEGQAADDVTTEAKLASYVETPFDDLLLVMTEKGKAPQKKKLSVKGTSLRSAVKGGAMTNLGRDAWLSLIQNSALQPNCNQEGLSVGNYVKVRIGIVANLENDCASPDSYVGVGGYGCVGTVVGNMACYNSTNGGDKNIPAFATIYVR
jgi:hypothetical protein